MDPNINSISFIVCCYNEECNIENTIKEINLAISKSSITNYEIIVVDDGSIDNTFQKVKELQTKNNKIVIVRNIKNIGFGGSIKNGLEIANLNRIMFLPGDNSHQNSEISKLINIDFKYDLVLTFYSNLDVRSFFRNFFTRLYTPFLNFIFGLNLPYYNGLGIYNRPMLSKISIYTNSFTWQIEVLIKLFKTKNINYIIVPTLLNDRVEGKSKAFSLKNSIYVIFSITRLFVIQFFLKNK